MTDITGTQNGLSTSWRQVDDPPVHTVTAGNSVPPTAKSGTFLVTDANRRPAYLDASGRILIGPHQGTTLMEWALKYAEHGYSVFPLAQGSKFPLKNCQACYDRSDYYERDKHVDGICTVHSGPSHCHGHKAATRDPSVIRGWWLSSPFCNIGINVGRSGIAVLDVDTRTKDDGTRKVGEETITVLQEAHGDLPGGPRVTTWSGGWQRYLTHPQGLLLKSSAGSDIHMTGLGQDVDIKALSAYAVAPPSLITGKHDSLVQGQYTWATDAWDALPVVPEWIPRVIKEREASKRPERAYSTRPWSTDPAPAGDVRERVQQLADTVAAAPEGVRNKTLNDNAFKAFQYAAAGQIDPDEVEFIFTQAGCAADPRDTAQVERTVASARNGAANKPYTWRTRGNTGGHAREGQDVTIDIPEPRTEDAPAPERGPRQRIDMLSVNTVYARKGDQMGCAELYVEDCDGGWPLRWNGQAERFYHYADGCWSEDDKRNTILAGLIDTVARKVTRLVDIDIELMRKQMRDGEGDADMLKELIKLRPNWYKTYRSAGGRAGILSFISTTVDRVRSEDMDADPYLLNFVNGTYDVRTGELREADPSDYLTHRVDHSLDMSLAEKPLAKVAPLFHGLLMRACAAPGEVDDETAAQRVQAVTRAVGSMISGECGDKAMFVFEGGTNIGKTVLLERIQAILGTQLATSSKPNLLIKTRGDKHDATEYSLKGRRFVLVNELTTQMTLDEGQVLRLINPGDSTLTVRRLGQQEEIINITWTIAITTNELPRARVTPQVLGRTVIFPMSQVPIPRADQDSSLPRRILAEEGTAVLAHLVKWWREWYLASQEGGSGLIITEEMTKALAEFKDDNASSATLFRDERTVADPDSTEKATAVWTQFNDWLSTQQPEVRREYQMGRTTFFKEVESWEGVEPILEHKAGRKPVRKGFKGFRLVTQDGIPIPRS